VYALENLIHNQLRLAIASLIGQWAKH